MIIDQLNVKTMFNSLQVAKLQSARIGYLSVVANDDRVNVSLFVLLVDMVI